MNVGRRSDQTEEPQPGRYAVRPFAVRFDVVAGRGLTKAVRQPFLEVFETWQILDVECPSWQFGDVPALDSDPLVVRKSLLFAGADFPIIVVNSADQGDALRGEGYEGVGGWAEIAENR